MAFLSPGTRPRDASGDAPKLLLPESRVPLHRGHRLVWCLQLPLSLAAAMQARGAGVAGQRVESLVKAGALPPDILATPGRVPAQQRLGTGEGERSR